MPLNEDQVPWVCNMKDLNKLTRKSILLEDNEWKSTNVLNKDKKGKNKGKGHSGLTLEHDCFLLECKGM